MAQLTYSLYEGILTGYLKGRLIQINTLSGGGGGAWGGASMPGLVNSLSATNVSLHGAQRGGPLPVGPYTICVPFPKGKHQRARLTPKFSTNRFDLEIHGRGEHGSDGCIVPLFGTRANATGTPAEKDAYWRAFDQFVDDLKREGGGSLYVLEAMGGSPKRLQPVELV